MTHIMVDLETLSTRCNAAIIAIGAVKFDEDKGVYAKFYQAVTPLEVNDPDFHVSSDTLNWWSKQSEEARAVFTDPNAVNIWVALKAFSDWVEKDTDKKDVRLWGNGASFDNAILSTAYVLSGWMKQPWEFWNDRCYRTIKNVAVKQVPLERIGTYHNALNDAESQAEHLLAMNVRLA
jgi:hypothetical protein